MKYINEEQEELLKIGSHVSNNGNDMLLNSVNEALSFQENCFMIYIGPPQNSFRKDISRFKYQEMKNVLKENNINIEDIIVHAPYIVNLAQNDKEKSEFAVSFLTKELKIMQEIGFKYYVIHPGSSVNSTKSVAITNIINNLVKILKNTKDDDTILCLETMAGKGNECCSNFEEIGFIVKSINNKRIRVCFDTCHVHDSGYDIVNNYEKVLEEFNELVGISNIKVLHVNDSQNICGLKKDRHANFGFGEIGFDTLIKFIYDERFINICKILETPYVKDANNNAFPPYKYEIKMIKEKQLNKNLLNNIIEEEKNANDK